jgi:prepilin-type N-terminal cleavage/methylation domain-containing protein
LEPSKPKYKLGINESSPGFTMIELLIAFIIFAMLVLAVTPLFKDGNYYWQAAQSQVELRQNLNGALDFISKEMRKADPESGAIQPESYPGIITYSADGSTYQIYVTGSNSGVPPYRHIVFDDGSAKVLTSPSKIDIISTNVYSSSTGYEIWLTGEYKGSNNLDSSRERLTVHTNVVPRRQN